MLFESLKESYRISGLICDEERLLDNIRAEVSMIYNDITSTLVGESLSALAQEGKQDDQKYETATSLEAQSLIKNGAAALNSQSVNLLTVAATVGSLEFTNFLGNDKVIRGCTTFFAANVPAIVARMTQKIKQDESKLTFDEVQKMQADLLSLENINAIFQQTENLNILLGSLLESNQYLDQSTLDTLYTTINRLYILPEMSDNQKYSLAVIRNNIRKLGYIKNNHESKLNKDADNKVNDIKRIISTNLNIDQVKMELDVKQAMKPEIAKRHKEAKIAILISAILGVGSSIMNTFEANAQDNVPQPTANSNQDSDITNVMPTHPVTGTDGIIHHIPNVDDPNWYEFANATEIRYNADIVKEAHKIFDGKPDIDIEDAFDEARTRIANQWGMNPEEAAENFTEALVHADQAKLAKALGNVVNNLPSLDEINKNAQKIIAEGKADELKKLGVESDELKKQLVKDGKAVQAENSLNNVKGVLRWSFIPLAIGSLFVWDKIKYGKIIGLKFNFGKEKPQSQTNNQNGSADSQATEVTQPEQVVGANANKDQPDEQDNLENKAEKPKGIFDKLTDWVKEIGKKEQKTYDYDEGGDTSINMNTASILLSLKNNHNLDSFVGTNINLVIDGNPSSVLLTYIDYHDDQHKIMFKSGDGSEWMLLESGFILKCDRNSGEYSYTDEIAKIDIAGDEITRLTVEAEKIEQKKLEFKNTVDYFHINKLEEGQKISLSVDGVNEVCIFNYADKSKDGSLKCFSFTKPDGKKYVFWESGSIYNAKPYTKSNDFSSVVVNETETNNLVKIQKQELLSIVQAFFGNFEIKKGEEVSFELNGEKIVGKYDGAREHESNNPNLENRYIFFKTGINAKNSHYDHLVFTFDKTTRECTEVKSFINTLADDDTGYFNYLPDIIGLKPALATVF